MNLKSISVGNVPKRKDNDDFLSSQPCQRHCQDERAVAWFLVGRAVARLYFRYKFIRKPGPRKKIAHLGQRPVRVN